MKKHTLFLLPLLSLPLSVMVFCYVNENKAEKANAYSATSLPETIDLNDCDSDTIKNYYSSLTNLAVEEKQGQNLLKNLKTILKNGQKYFSYENGDNVWKMYEITDRDWEKSPASSTIYGTYNAKTNKITNYTYGTSASNSKNNPYIHALYVNRNVENQVTAWDDHQQTQWGINREHVWAKAEGFDSKGAGGARGDPMHLMAGNGYANNIHSNHFFGYVNTSSSYTNCGTKYSNLNGNLSGKSKTLGGTESVFEPQDSDKGDIARIIFYMVARYNYLSGSDSDGIDSNNPNLALTQSLSNYSSSGYTSSASRKGYMGVLTDLLAWHHADPVDEYEIHRNNLLYRNFTNNRNPFIDYPEWADYIWGTANYNGNTYQSYDETPTGYVDLNNDVINGYRTGGSTTVTVESVSLDKNSLSLSLGGTYGLTATVSPSNATNKAVSWTSSNTSVATVSSSGLVTAKAAGNTTITVRTADGNKTATCSVTVNAKTLSSITISGQTTAFDVGDEFTFGGTVTAHYSDSSSSDVTNLALFTGYNMSLPGTQTVTVTYENKTTTYQITVTGGSQGEEGEETGSAVAVGSHLEGWTEVGVSKTYADGSVRLDDSGDNVYKLDIFSENVAENMTNLQVTVNGKLNGTDSSDNLYRVEALDSSGNVLATDFFLGKIGTSYSDRVFEISSNLTGCTGIRVKYETKDTGNWAIKSISWTATYDGTVPTATSITASVEKTYHVGETIIKDDIYVIDDLLVERTDFDFEDYLFTYDEVEGGETTTTVEFLIVVDLLETTLEVEVCREAPIEQITDVLIPSFFGEATTSYINFSDKVDESGVKYSGNCLPRANYIQIRATDKNQSGIVATSSTFTIAKVVLEWTEIDNNNSKSVQIYGSNTAYSGYSDLFDENTKGDLLGTLSYPNQTTLLVSSGNYNYIGIRSSNSTAYLNRITITYGRASLNDLANYIMYEDTNNQCLTKLDTAIEYFNGLTVSERNTFMTSDDYVIAAARERLEAWATNQGKMIIHIDGDYSVSGSIRTDLLTYSSDNQ